MCRLQKRLMTHSGLASRNAFAGRLDRESPVSTDIDRMANRGRHKCFSIAAIKAFLNSFGQGVVRLGMDLCNNALSDNTKRW